MTSHLISESFKINVVNDRCFHFKSFFICQAMPKDNMFYLLPRSMNFSNFAYFLAWVGISS